jgi:hypothetical protein
MKPAYAVKIDSAGCPYLEVPPALLWGLVEYLSYRREHVAYHFDKSHFKVTFPHLDLRGAQHLLEEWEHADNHQLLGA